MQQESERPYHHGNLRSAVIATAMDMLAEGEAANFTLREVSRRAGVSHAAPYKHFPDKSALLAEVALVGFERLREAMADAQANAPGELRAELFEVARAYIGFGQANPALYRLMFGGEIGDRADVHLDSRALSAFDVVIDLLSRGQEAGIIRARAVRGQAAACWAQLHGLTMLMLDGLLRSPEKVGENPVEAALETLFEGLDASR